MEIVSQSRKKMRSLAEVIKECERVQYDLPKEVLAFILSQLSLKDNIRASAVSTHWLASAVSVRRANSPPLLMYFPKQGNSYEFYDPSTRKMYRLDLPEIRGSRIRYARDNWLLMEKLSSGNFFLFCPYTREKVLLPHLQFSYVAVAFSCSPKPPDCVIFALSPANRLNMIIGIRTCRPGKTEWKSSYHQGPLNTTFKSWSQVVFSSGCFYCLTLSGQLGIFNVAKRSWTFYPTPPLMLLKEGPSFEKSWTVKFMAEHDGMVYIVCVCASKNPVICMLNKESEMKLDSLCGLTIFANDISSQVWVDLSGKLAGNIVFSKVMLYGRRCVVYSPGQRRYYPNNSAYNWNVEKSLDRVWIQAPEDMTSIFH